MRFPQLPAAPQFNDPLAPSGGAPSGRGIVCSFCKCRLDAEGDIVKMGDVAKAYSKLEDKLADATATVDAHKGTIAELTAKVKELEKEKPATAPASSENMWP